MRKKLVIKFLIIFLLCFAISIFLQSILKISLEDLKAFVGNFGIWAPIIYTIILTLGLSVPFNPVSDFLTVNLAAFIFPPVVAISGTFIAHSLAITINFWIAKKFGWRFLSKILNDDEANYMATIENKITLTQVFWLRWLLPVTAIGVDIVSYASGLASLNFIRFFLVSIIPWTIINILYFSSTSFIIDRTAVLFFIPAVFIVMIPIAILFLIRKKFPSKITTFLKNIF